MKLFGDSLREAREARGVTLDAIAQDTHIGRQYLDALERSDLDSLPGGVFDKGYIRSYAQVLGIDPQPILEAYRVEERSRGRGTPEDERQRLEQLSRLLDQRTGRNKVGLFWAHRLQFGVGVVVLGFLASATWFWLRPKTDRVGRHTEHRFERRVESDPLSQPATGPEGSVAVKSGGAESEAKAGADPKATAASAKRERTLGLEQGLRPGSADGRLTVSESGVGTGIVERQLVGRSDGFPEGAWVFFWTRVVGGESGDVIRHVWSHEGRLYMNAVLEIGGPHWRTYSSYRLSADSLGSWTVEARGADGAVLAREEFLCSPPPRNLQTRR